MTRVAVIDVGTVTARLAIAEVAGGRVRSLTKRSTIVNLGEGVDHTGLLTDGAQRRLLACIDDYLADVRAAGQLPVCCTLTSAARDARNSAGLLAELAARGLDAQVIPGEVEGSLTFLGVAGDFLGHRIMVADNGGGSTELAVGSLAADGLHLEWVRSINVGCRRVTEKFLSRQDPPAASDVQEAHAFAGSNFAPYVPWAAAGVGAELAAGIPRGPQPERLIVTGGTVTTLVASKKELVPYDSTQVHLAELTRAEILDLEAKLASLTVAQRAELAGIQAKRAPVILGGAVAVAELMAQTGFDRLTVSESDLLFGMSIVAAATLDGAESPVGWKPRMSQAA